MARLLLVLLLCWPGVVNAAGFAIADQGAASSALGGAVTARTDIPEGGFYNPSAYTMTPGTWVYLGAGVLAPTLTWDGPDASASTDFALATPPQVHITHAFDFLAVHLGLTVPFGSSLAWPDRWPGRYEVQETRLQVFELAQDVAVRPLQELSVSAGYRVQLGSLGIVRAIDVARPGRDARVGLSAGGLGFAWAASALYVPTPSLQLGLSVRSGSSIEMRGDADFQDVPIELESRAHDTRFGTTLKTPWRVAAGVALPLQDMQISADVEVWTWSSFDALEIDFEDPGVEDTRLDRDWSNTVSVRFGYEYKLLENDALRLRAGFAWDPSPANPATLGPSSPDSNRISGALGASWDWGTLAGHGSVGYTGFLGADAVGEYAFEGRYGGGLWSLNLGVSAQFGQD